MTTMHTIRVAFLKGRKRPIVRCAQDGDTKLWCVYRMVPHDIGHTFDRQLADGFKTRKAAEAWAKQWRSEND